MRKDTSRAWEALIVAGDHLADLIYTTDLERQLADVLSIVAIARDRFELTPTLEMLAIARFLDGLTISLAQVLDMIFVDKLDATPVLGKTAESEP